MKTLRAGAYRVTRLVDGVYKAPVGHLMHLSRPERASEVALRWGRPTIDVPVNVFLLQGPAGVILIDAGAGESWGPDYGRARAAMTAMGVAPADVGLVLLTHLHGDHALGLMQDGAAFFRNARIVAPQAELAYFTDARAKEALAPERRGAFDVAAKLLAAYGDRVATFESGRSPAPGVESMALPGHTPGHTGFVVGGALFLFGDALHVDALQSADPDLGFVYDVDPAEAAASRRDALESAARAGWIVCGGHIGGFKRVAAQDHAWRLRPA